MASKTTALSAVTAPTTDDVAYLVDDPGGTPVSKKITLLNLFGILPMAGLVSVTGATTATIGRWHYCTGTTADYTLTLPAASGNTGKMIGVIMAPLASLSKLVTLDGNGSEAINGSTTRVMWAGESALLYCDGSNWFKIGGTSVAMACRGLRNTVIGGITGSYANVKIPLNNVVFDPTGVMVNTTNGRIDIKRPGTYAFGATIVFDNLDAAVSVQVRIHKNGDTANAVAAASLSYGSNGWYPQPYAGFLDQSVAGDYYELYALHSDADNAADLYVLQDLNWLYAQEVPQW